MRKMGFVAVAVAVFGWGMVVEHPQVRAATSTETASAEAINKAGRQRMLSQRIVKAYCQVGLNIFPDEARRQIETSVTLFSKQIEFLQNIPHEAGLQETLKLTENLWRELTLLLKEEPRPELALRLLYLSEDLLYMSDKVVRLLQDRSNTSHARLVNISGRQRMLSQRMAKLYLLKAWGINTRSIDDDLDLAAAMFDEGLRELHNAPESTSQILRELEIVNLQWEWFKYALSVKGDRSYSLIVADASETILQSMETLTGLYEQLASSAK